MSDLPKIQSGKLRVLYKASDNSYYPAKLVTTRGGSLSHNLPGFIISLPEYDFFSLLGVSSAHAEFFVDVTPEKRYAIWNKTAGRFVTVSDVHGTPHFTCHLDAELYIKTYFIHQESRMAVVEFDFPGEVE